MTISSHKTSGSRRNSFDTDTNSQEDDLILADLQVVPDDSQLKITPLQHWTDDEDDIDRLLVNTGFETNTGTKQSDELFVENINMTDEPAELDMFLHQSENRDYKEPTITPLQDLANDEDLIDKLLVDTGFDSAIEAEQPDELTIEDIDLSNELDFDTSCQHSDADILDIAAVEPEINPITPVAEPVPKSGFQVENFISAYLAMRPDVKIAETETDATISSEEYGEAGNQAAEIQQKPVETFQQRMGSIANEIAVSDSVIEPASEPEAAVFQRAGENRRHESGKNNQSTTLGYVILAFAIGALLVSTITLTVTVVDMRTEMTRLSELLEIVKDDVEALNEKSSATIGRSGSVAN